MRHALFGRSELQSGDSVDGMLVFNYPLDAAQWGNRKAMAVTVSSPTHVS